MTTGLFFGLVGVLLSMLLALIDDEMLRIPVGILLIVYGSFVGRYVL